MKFVQPSASSSRCFRKVDVNALHKKTMMTEEEVNTSMRTRRSTAWRQGRDSGKTIGRLHDIVGMVLDIWMGRPKWTACGEHGEHVYWKV